MRIAPPSGTGRSAVPRPPPTNERAKEIDMNWDRIERNWKQLSGKVKERWGKLTNDDLDRIKGKRDQLEGKLQDAYGIQREEARKDVDEFCKSL
jgi:uncharacterized protein YjbJ (UPF0337 family)